MPLARKASLVKFRNTVRDTIRNGKRRSMGPNKLAQTLELDLHSDETSSEEPTALHLNGSKSNGASPSCALFSPTSDWNRGSYQLSSSVSKVVQDNSLGSCNDRFGPNKQGDTSKLDSKSIYASGSDSDDASKVLSTTDKAMTPPYGRSRSSKNDRQAVIKSGYLKKQGAKMKNWSERWFVLQSDSLHYYKERDGKYLGSIFLSGCQVGVSQSRLTEANKFIFEIIPGSEQTKINNNHESYLLASASHADMDSWMKAIKRVIFSPFGGGIFGQKLDDTLTNDRRRDSSTNVSKVDIPVRSSPRLVPIIVENCIEFIRSNKGLKEEGLFRLPGQSNEVKDLQDAYDKGDRPMFSKTTDVHTVASLLKGYLRELPEPVIPFEQYEDLINASKQSQTEQGTPAGEGDSCLAKEKQEARKAMKNLVDLLPLANFNLLRYLCQFLFEVQQHSESNKMDTSNLALVFGPNIMKAKEESAITMMADTAHVQHVMYNFITDHKYFFPSDKMILPTHSQDDIESSGDAGIGTMTTTGSPRGTLRLGADDSGTGSLDTTPENTQKRAPNLPSVPPPARRPLKPKRKASNISIDNKSLSPTDNSHNRKSVYDNVALSPCGNDAETLSNLSVSAVLGSSREALDSPVSNPSHAEFRNRVLPVAARPRRSSPTSGDAPEISNFQNQRSSLSSTSHDKDNRPLHPVAPRRVGGKVAANIERLSVGSQSDECPLTSYSAVPSKTPRKPKKNDGNMSSSSQRSSKTDLETLEHSSDLASVFEKRSNSHSVSPGISGRPPTYEELEAQVHSLKEELRKQRLEHEKRSKMLEEHYVMKMKSFGPAAFSISGTNNNDLRSRNDSSPSFDCADDSIDQSGHTTAGRTLSIDSQGDTRYREEAKRHQMTKIRLRNVERGLKQAEERNQQLQKEMEEFFNTFGINGGMLENAAS